MSNFKHQSDKRITHLKKIIDGANNAYSANTIDKNRRNEIRSEAESVIQEYKKVMEGKTSLSKVSEMKKSYKAKVGQNNSTVKQIQEKLYELGYTSQLTTGYYGDITFNTVAYFQIVNGLTVTGWVDNETYKGLMNSTTNVSAELEKIHEQLNTFPLSKTDIEKGVKVVTIGVNQYYDCTEVLNEVFLQCAEEAKRHKLLYPELFTDFIVGIPSTLPYKASIDINNMLWFISKVDNGEDWDIKLNVNWDKTVGTTFPGPNGTVMFFGKLYTISELGNILYGYTGTAMRIPEEILYMGGGFAAIKGLKFIILEGYGDLEDRSTIKEGIEWYKKEYH